MTVTQLARACALSRSTVLYYESLGLLKPPRRTSGNYRAYGERDILRLRQICMYRDAGLKLGDIRGILEQPAGNAAAVLERRLVEIEAEIVRMREHQSTILQLLKSTGKLRRLRMITKEKWTEIMRAAGLTDAGMHRWHAEFEKQAPAEHQEFLQFLQIPSDELARIREWSRTATT